MRNVWRANLLLYLAIGALLLLFRQELAWAWRELPKYPDQRIGSPLERRLYRQATRLIEANQPAEARALLQRSLEIDPYGEAGYWLGRAWLREGNDERALEALTRYLAIDPNLADAHLKAASILERGGRVAEARSVLRDGLTYFQEAERRQRTRRDPEVSDRYNQKAAYVHASYAAGVRALERELGRLEARREGTAEPVREAKPGRVP